PEAVFWAVQDARRALADDAAAGTGSSGRERAASANGAGSAGDAASVKAAGESPDATAAATR
ncbi:MAG: hypothetical protein L0G85_11010, partial [Kocuria sp.]|nr:hypothetical protein [Kocuria sp.]